MVEAAMLFPVILLVVFSFIKLSLNLYDRTVQSAAAHEENIVLGEISVFPEDLLRSRWVLTQIKEKKEKGKEEEKDDAQ